MEYFCVGVRSIEQKSTPPHGILNGTKIEFWTQRSLSLTLVDVPQEADHRRRQTCTETFPPKKTSSASYFVHF